MPWRDELQWDCGVYLGSVAICSISDAVSLSIATEAGIALRYESTLIQSLPRKVKKREGKERNKRCDVNGCKHEFFHKRMIAC